ncbi:MAG: exodeoxyribonuclease VII large subunit [Defluviitaleaceae bacterium]|nr:exodeoxyribonuclease VII large subunit [Defluviitaleaceae bacterium]
MNRKILTVSQVNRYIKMVLEEDVFLNDVFIQGEISNFKNHSSGHWYFSLKDETAAIQCVMFRSYVPSSPGFVPKDGMSVIVGGHVSLYEKTGQYQMYAEMMEPLGKGSLALAFEQMKEKLEKEGLFDIGRKRPIPPFPRTVAIITSPTGAAIRDIITVAQGRNPLVELVAAPALVQGAAAAKDIARALDIVNAWGMADVIILGRGGGSMEDLWPFNEEAVARAIYRSKIPVISAVGHETDVTIADFAADLRAPTPTAAAALAVPDLWEMRADVDGFYGALNYSLESKLASAKERLARLSSRPALKRPLEPVRNAQAYVGTLQRRMSAAFANRLAGRRAALGACAAALEHLSPMRTLERGFAVVEGPEGVISTVSGVAPGMAVGIRFADGTAKAEIK